MGLALGLPVGVGWLVIFLANVLPVIYLAVYSLVCDYFVPTFKGALLIMAMILGGTCLMVVATITSDLANWVARRRALSSISSTTAIRVATWMDVPQPFAGIIGQGMGTLFGWWDSDIWSRNEKMIFNHRSVKQPHPPSLGVGVLQKFENNTDVNGTSVVTCEHFQPVFVDRGWKRIEDLFPLNVEQGVCPAGTDSPLALSEDDDADFEADVHNMKYMALLPMLLAIRWLSKSYESL